MEEHVTSNDTNCLLRHESGICLSISQRCTVRCKYRCREQTSCHRYQQRAHRVLLGFCCHWWLIVLIAGYASQIHIYKHDCFVFCLNAYTDIYGYVTVESINSNTEWVCIASVNMLQLQYIKHASILDSSMLERV